MRSKEVIRRLESAGFELVRVKGSHHIFRKPGRPGIITVPHPKSELGRGLLRSLERDSGIKLR